MANRGGPGSVTQRRFDPDPPATPPVPAGAIPPEVSSPTVRPLPPAAEVAAPSGRALRERQSRWLAERARFEASQRTDDDVGERKPPYLSGG